MITLKMNGRTHTIPNDSFMAIQDTSDGMYFRFKDGGELRILCPVTAQVKAISNILMKSTAKDITIDFNAKNMITLQG
jgi:hypothetical protein